MIKENSVQHGKGVCPHCSQRLDIGTQGLFLDSAKEPVTYWREGRWKTCPKCSKLEGAHVFLPFPADFGGTGLRKPAGEVVPQSDCNFHRGAGNATIADPKLAGLACSKSGPQLLSHTGGERPGRLSRHRYQGGLAPRSTAELRQLRQRS